MYPLWEIWQRVVLGAIVVNDDPPNIEVVGSRDLYVYRATDRSGRKRIPYPVNLDDRRILHFDQPPYL